jgi:drug/metabolite transporter (DMT)-like permease
MFAGLLALLASLSWGTSDFVAGVETRRTTAWAAALVGQSAAAVGSVTLLVILAPSRPALGVLAFVALGGVSSAAGVFATYRSFALIKMSVAAPIIASAALVPVLWGLAHGERPGLLALAGMVVTLLGIAVISRSGPARPVASISRSGSGKPAAHVPLDRMGVALAVAAAVSLGLMLVAFDYGATADPYWTVAVMRLSATLCVAVSLGATRPALRLRRRSLPLLVGAGLLIMLANALFTTATTKGDLSVVAVLGWLGPAVTVLWARVLLREQLRPAQWVAAALVLAGVVCLALT